MNIPKDIALTIPQRIMIANGLYFVVSKDYHLSEEGSCIGDAAGILSDYQACVILEDGINMALAAQANLQRILDTI